jgi:Zn-dependent peptidase ImmA (M78 family)
MYSLYKQALLKADEIRRILGLNMFESVNIFDACEILGLTVRFLDVNMEGLYTRQSNGSHPTIILSALRPLPRRCFTCAHELGHHVFEHGSKLDLLSFPEGQAEANNSEEFLVDCFAGALLMPLAGVQSEFAKRKWNIKKASPIQFFTIASVFSTGYQTLVTHCKANKIISESQAKNLSKVTPSKIFKSLFPRCFESSYFKIIDAQFHVSVVDLEVSNYIILSPSIKIEGDQLIEASESSVGTGYLAIKPGILRAYDTFGKQAFFVRIQNYAYIGLAENRHLENEPN